MSTRTIQQLLDLSGKTALVTGGSRGLGLQMAHAFAKKSMIARRSGRIINIASVAGLNGNGEGMNTIAYNTSKAAAIEADSPDAGERRPVLAAAKSLVGQSARVIGQEAVQLHGGMGVTDELPISHYSKRLTAIDMTFGDAAYHRGALRDLLASVA